MYYTRGTTLPDKVWSMSMFLSLNCLWRNFLSRSYPHDGKLLARTEPQMRRSPWRSLLTGEIFITKIIMYDTRVKILLEKVWSMSMFLSLRVCLASLKWMKWNGMERSRTKWNKVLIPLVIIPFHHFLKYPNNRLIDHQTNPFNSTPYHTANPNIP